jgi:hypothetical protein
MEPRLYTRGRLQQQGLSLLEVMLLILITSGALVAGFIALKARDASNAAQRQAAQLLEADRMLVGFAAAYHRLPCPDTNRDGLEDCGSAAQKGWLPYRTLGLEGASKDAGVGNLRYLVQRNAIDLAVATDTWKPVAFKDNKDKYTGQRKYPGSFSLFGNAAEYSVVTTPDLCGKLKTGVGNPLEGSHAQLSSTPARAVAFAIAHPGARDEAGTGDLFDTANSLAGNSLGAPERGSASAAADDRVLARGYDNLALALDCTRLTASLDMLSLAMDMVEEVQSQELSNTVMATVLAAVNVVKTAVAIYKVVAAATQLVTSAGYLATATAELATAIGTCAILVGCAAIPHATASVVAATISVGASTAAVVASGYGAGLSVVATALTASAGVMAGVTVKPGVDFSEALTSAESARKDAADKRDKAYAEWQKAKGNEEALRSSKDSSLQSARQKMEAIVRAANEAGDPKGTRPLNSLEGYLNTVISKADALSTARINYEDAKQAYESAEKLANQDQKLPQATMNEYLRVLNEQIEKETDPVRRNAIIEARDKLLLDAGSSKNISEQIDKLNLQIADFETQIAGVDQQLKQQMSDEARQALQERRNTLQRLRDDLVAQRNKLQSQLANVAPDLAGKKAQMEAAQKQLDTATKEFQDAYSAAVSAAFLPYSAKECDSEGKKCTTVTRYYDGRSGMEAALKPLFADGKNSIYFKWKGSNAETLAAEALYQRATEAASQADSAYQAILGITQAKDPISVFLPSWKGAEAILIRADEKGGMR